MQNCCTATAENRPIAYAEFSSSKAPEGLVASSGEHPSVAVQRVVACLVRQIGNFSWTFGVYLSRWASTVVQNRADAGWWLQIDGILGRKSGISFW